MLLDTVEGLTSRCLVVIDVLFCIVRTFLTVSQELEKSKLCVRCGLVALDLDLDSSMLITKPDEYHSLVMKISKRKYLAKKPISFTMKTDRQK